MARQKKTQQQDDHVRWPNNLTREEIIELRSKLNLRPIYEFMYDGLIVSEDSKSLIFDPSTQLDENGAVIPQRATLRYPLTGKEIAFVQRRGLIGKPIIDFLMPSLIRDGSFQFAEDEPDLPSESLQNH